MSNIDELVAKVNPKGTNPKKEELWEFVKGALELIGKIDSYYKKLHEGDGDNASLAQEIEDAYEAILREYNDLFGNDPQGASKVSVLSEKIEEIQKYHSELLNEDGIKADIKDSQEKITEFYNYLFGDEDVEGKTKKSIKDIGDFYTKLKQEGGLEDEIVAAYDSIVTKHSDLFDAEEGEKSKVDDLEEKMKSVADFQTKINDEIAPSIKKQREDLAKLNVDVETKRKEVGALLSDATAKSLANGYLESMGEYSAPKALKHKPFSDWRNIPHNAYVFGFNILGRYAKTIFSYLTFVGPLIVIVYLFSQSDIMSAIISSVTTTEIIDGKTVSRAPTVQELIFLKALIGLPLLWISWFGQKSISQRKRLFEEYNHKFRVVQMYIMFVSNEKTYSLKQTKELETALLEVIKNNPAVHLGKGETMIDRLFEKFQIEGLYEKLKEDLKKDLKDLIKP